MNHYFNLLLAGTAAIALSACNLNPFHEPAKWVARLRRFKTDDNIVLLYMNMESGHGGATGRYDSIKEIVFEWAFILNRVGISK